MVINNIQRATATRATSYLLQPKREGKKVSQIFQSFCCHLLESLSMIVLRATGPVDKGRKLTVLGTFNLRPVSAGGNCILQRQL